MSRGCEACRYSRATAHDGLYCGRDAAVPYPCEVERASSPFEAWLYGACGTRGRFFEAKAAAPAWSAAAAIDRSHRPAAPRPLA